MNPLHEGEHLQQSGPSGSEGPSPSPEPGIPPCTSLEEIRGFPTQFARWFFGALTLLVLYYSYEIIKPYLVDIFLALVLFFTAKPLFRGLTRLLFGMRALASALTCVFLALLILVPLVTLVSIIANQALEFSIQVSQGLKSGQLGEWLDVKVNLLKSYLLRLNLPLPPEQLKLEDILQSVLKNASIFIYNNAIGLLKGFTTFLLDLALVLFVAFFMFLRGDDFIAEIKKLSPLDAAHNDMILGEMEATIKATLWGTVVVAFIQGALGGLGFLLFGVPQAAFWGTVMVPASVLPVVGAAIIWGPAVIYLMVKGAMVKGLGLFFFCALVIGSIDNLVKPLLMRGTRSTPSIFVLFSILGGISYFGMIGFILGPLVLSFLLSLLSIYQKTILVPGAVPPVGTPESQKPTSP
jgi:predicted PurR-regulated permease PerM